MWFYEGSQQTLHTISIVGEEEILGTLTRVRRQVEHDQIFENFWTTDENDHLYLHGARNLTHSFA